MAENPERIQTAKIDCHGVTAQGSTAFWRPVAVEITTFSPGKKFEVVDNDCRFAVGDRCHAGESTQLTQPLCPVSKGMVEGTIIEERTSALTPQMRETLTALAEGTSRQQMCRKLGVTYDSLKDRVEASKRRLDTVTSPGAVAKALDEGLLPEHKIRESLVTNDNTGLQDLSPRQTIIVELYAHDAGASKAELGKLIGIGRHTVQTDLNDAYLRTGVRTPESLVALRALDQKDRQQYGGNGKTAIA